MSLDLDVHRPGIAGGDARAFAAWVAGAEPPLRRSLRGFAAAVDVEAVLQETLLRAWQLAPRLEPDGEPNVLLRFAMRAARNLAISATRGARELPDGDAGASLGVEPAPPDPLLRRLLILCREKLRGKPARAFEARLADGGAQPDAGLARGLGMTLNTFLQNVTRARRLLGDCLRKQGVELP